MDRHNLTNACGFAGESRQLEATKKWFKEAQFGMMAHWGLYTLLGGEWNGRPCRHRLRKR